MEQMRRNKTRQGNGWLYRVRGSDVPVSLTLEAKSIGLPVVRLIGDQDKGYDKDKVTCESSDSGTCTQRSSLRH